MPANAKGVILINITTGKHVRRQRPEVRAEAASDVVQANKYTKTEALDP